MNAFDLSPLFRHSVGFDRLKNALEAAGKSEDSGQPAYDIVRTGDNSYEITIVAPGFSAQDIEIETRENVLKVEVRGPEPSEERTYVHQGISTDGFARTFQLADHVNVVNARLDSGLLHVELVREVPEALKPRRITIDTAAAQARKDGHLHAA